MSVPLDRLISVALFYIVIIVRSAKQPQIVFGTSSATAVEDNAAPNESTLPSAPGLQPVEVHPKRYIPKAVRDKVYARDGGTCAFIGTNGHRCGVTWDLEYEHIVPFARGGSNDESNLMMLCRAHNNYRAEQIYGAEFMKKKRDELEGKHFRCGSNSEASELFKLNVQHPETKGYAGSSCSSPSRKTD